MADGKTHLKFHNKFWLPGLGIATGIALLSFKTNVLYLFLFGAFYIIFYWMGENLISPDLDLISISGQDGRAVTFGEKIAVKLKKLKVLGKLIGFILGLPALLLFLWGAVYSYAMQFLGGHRNIFSHGIIIGTILRMVWFNLLIISGMVLFYSYGVSTWKWTNSFSFDLYLDIWLLPYFMAQFLAWFISDSIHLILDSQWSKGKLY